MYYRCVSILKMLMYCIYMYPNENSVGDYRVHNAYINYTKSDLQVAKQGRTP